MSGLPSALVRARAWLAFATHCNPFQPIPTKPKRSVLAVSKQGVDARAKESFLDETFLADRKTTVREWLEANPGIMEEQPPEELKQR